MGMLRNPVMRADEEHVNFNFNTNLRERIRGVMSEELAKVDALRWRGLREGSHVYIAAIPAGPTRDKMPRYLPAGRPLMRSSLLTASHS